VLVAGLLVCVSQFWTYFGLEHRTTLAEQEAKEARRQATSLSEQLAGVARELERLRQAAGRVARISSPQAKANLPTGEGEGSPVRRSVKPRKRKRTRTTKPPRRAEPGKKGEPSPDAGPAFRALCTCLVEPQWRVDGAAPGSGALRRAWSDTLSLSEGGLSNFTLLGLLWSKMHQDLRVYMYPRPVWSTRPLRRAKRRGFALEWHMYRRLLSWGPRTDKPLEANLFYLPVFPTAIRFSIRDRNAGGEKGAREVRDVVKSLSRFNFFDKHGGADHFWVSGHDGGKYEYSNLANPRLAANSHCITNTADPHRGPRRDDIEAVAPFSFNPATDVAAVAGASDSFWLDAWSLSKPLASRSTFAFFAGKLHSDGRDQGVRKAVEASFKAASKAADPSGESASSRVGGYLSPELYKQGLSESVFCLCPRGSTVWSERLIDAIVFGCIPVVLADTCASIRARRSRSSFSARVN